MKPSVKRKNGFTLLEMLVVIGIIAVLIGMGAVAYSAAQKKARDAKRKGDLHAIQSAMEQYYSLCGFTYPTGNGDLTGSLICGSTGQVFITYPYNPLGTNSRYKISNATDGSSYLICPPVANTTTGSFFESEDCHASGPPCCISNSQ
ncbi:type II secretion system protein [Candidatus Roizmanbacteria bacterium]|nr:type II secretion system protein [Candidatus Roizmanbacteria bacterium]